MSPERNRLARVVVWASLGASACAGCTSPGADFDDPTPTIRINAVERAVASGDRSAIPRMIGLLDSDDAAVRLFAINGLEQLTGQRLGYDHAGPERERRAAAAAWAEWYTATGQGGSGGAAARGEGRLAGRGGGGSETGGAP